MFLFHNLEKQQTLMPLWICVIKITRDASFVLPIHCGPEIGVASTKAFLGQMLVLYIFSLKLSVLNKDLDNKAYVSKIKDLKNLIIIPLFK